jgi:hypothetical protein
VLDADYLCLPIMCVGYGDGKRGMRGIRCAHLSIFLLCSVVGGRLVDVVAVGGRPLISNTDHPDSS